MKITFTIEIDENKSVTVSQAPVPTVPLATEEGEEMIPDGVVKEDKEVKPAFTRTWIGEGTPGNKGKGTWHKLTGGTNYPYCAAQIKDLMEKMNTPVATVGKAIGMNPITFRNLLRRDDRGFTEEDYNVIMNAIQQVRSDKNKEII